MAATRVRRDVALGPGSERRTYFRVLSQFPLKYRLIHEEELEAVILEIQSRAAPDFSDLDPALATWLDRIDSKLDALLLERGIADQSSFRDEDLREVAISGSGMRFGVAEEIVEGDALLVDFQLPGPPPQLVRCLTRVVRRIEDDEGLRVPCSAAVAFEVIHETDRDAVVRHAVDVQRFHLRERVALASTDA